MPLVKEDVEAFDMSELANLFVSIRDELADAKSNQSSIQADFDMLRKEIIPAKMEELGFDNVKIAGVGRVSLRAEAYASMVKDMKPDAHDWLRNNGHGELIKDTVNPSTLKAFLKEQVNDGVEIPDDLFNFSPYLMATVTKG